MSWDRWTLSRKLEFQLLYTLSRESERAAGRQKGSFGERDPRGGELEKVFYY